MSDKGWSTTSWSRKSEKQYVVPEGGLKAALCQVDYARAHSGVEEGIIKRALQDFVRWLYDELDSLEHKPYDDVLAHEYNACLADVRRMFLAPEPEESAYMRVTKSMGAVTLSEEEGNKILEFVKGAIHAEYRTPEPAVPNLKYCPTCGVDTTPLGVPFSHSSPWGRTMPGHTELEIPEAVKDLGCTPEQLATLDGVNKEIAIRANNAIAEAYRRGLKGEK
jgi:hypothetical protein